MVKKKYYITPHPLTPFPASQSTLSGSVMSDEKP